ncbi:hypothetical protein AB3S75_015089 [Citrus x aurantiifolia]
MITGMIPDSERELLSPRRPAEEVGRPSSVWDASDCCFICIGASCWFMSCCGLLPFLVLMVASWCCCVEDVYKDDVL